MRRAWKKTREEISKPIYIEYREIWAQEKGREPNSVNVMATERAGRSIFKTYSHSGPILDFWTVDVERFEDQGKSESGALRK